MSTLDQAFIRAYQSGATARRAPPPPSSAAPRTTASIRALPIAVPIRSAEPLRATAVSGATEPQRYVDAAHVEASGPHYGTPGAGRATDEALAAAPAIAGVVADDAAWQPAFETPRFVWPRTVEVLVAAAGNEFARFVQTLEERVRAGRKMLAVTGVERGEGRTTLTAALARLAANRRLRTVVVDADLQAPSLAELLGIRPELGWDEAAGERMAVGDALVESVEDGVTLLPLRSGVANPRALAGNGFLPAALAQLRSRYDLVLVDLGPLTDDAQTIDLAAVLGGNVLDDALVVRDRRRTTPQQIHDVGRRLAALGVRRWDVAENFSELSHY